jgi:predicted lysophospholipase L1 biosynthesis ABC-type transport system permease subunit
MKFMGSSKISTNLRVSIVQDVAKELKLDVGDHVLFYMDEKGNIIIQKG